MRISKLNVAVLVQAAGLMLILLFWNPIVRILGVLLIVIGAVLYRREKKRLKVEATTQPPQDTA